MKGKADTKKRIAIILFIIIVISLISTSYYYVYLKTDTSLSEPEPVFNITFFSIVDSGDVGHLQSHTAFAENYSGEDLSIEFRDELIAKLMNQVGNSGCNNTTLMKAFRTVYWNWSAKPTKIPCYVRYVFHKQELHQIGIAFNRAFWLDEQNLDRQDIYVFSGVLLSQYSTEECIMYSDFEQYQFPPNPITDYWGLPDF